MMLNSLPTTRARAWPLAVIASAALAACGGGGGDAAGTNTLPQGMTQHSVTTYSATARGSGTTAATQDLLTGGLGRTGLGGAVPTYADPANPTALELRRNALHSNYRGILDIAPNGGYGSLYGPNVNNAGTVTTSEGLIPGREYLVTIDDGSGRKKVTVAVLVPDSFDTATPCIVLGPSSGSRGVYGAIGSSGEWGLKRGCAVALTDAGKGVGLYDPTDDSVNRIDGTRATRTAAGALAHYAANISDSVRAAFNAAFPNRLSIKQAHSQLNPEKDWGSDTLMSAKYALYALNDRFGTTFNPMPYGPGNVMIIAGSVSNGGAAVVRAGELDTEGLVDGVVAAEPVLEMPTRSGYGVQFAGAPVAGYGYHLAEQVTIGNLYQPCAALAPAAAISETSFFNYLGLAAMTARAEARCNGLAAKGLVNGSTTAERAADALARLHAAGWDAGHDQMHNAHYALGNGPILAAMYPMAYGRFSMVDNICNTSFASVDAAGNVVPVNAVARATSFAIANGTANGVPAAVVYNDSVGGAKAWQFAVSPSTGVADFGLDNAICQRALVTGTNPVTGATLTASTTPTKAQSDAVRAGMAETTFSGNLRGKPSIIVAGRSDALVQVNNNARAYAAYNRVVEGPGTKLRYIEVTNAQHFDAFLGLSGWDTRFVPLHVYFNRAMDAMYAHLKSGTALPASQVVRTTPRGGAAGAAPAITATNVPAWSSAPATGDQIGFSGTSIAVPN